VTLIEEGNSNMGLNDNRLINRCGEVGDSFLFLYNNFTFAEKVVVPDFYSHNPTG